MGEGYVQAVRDTFHAAVHRLTLRIADLSAAKSQLVQTIERLSARCTEMLKEYRCVQGEVDRGEQCRAILEQECALMRQRIQQVRADTDVALRRSHRKSIQISLHTVTRETQSEERKITAEKQRFSAEETELKSVLSNLLAAECQTDSEIAAVSSAIAETQRRRAEHTAALLASLRSLR